jgi:dipeptidyl aminopeptidase/acylaminoacyl peptidase
MMRRLQATIAALLLTLTPAFAEEAYKKPSQAILDVLNAPVSPQTSVSPARDYMFLANQLSYPPIADLAQPMLRLAGLRINPTTNGPHRGTYFIALAIKKISDGSDIKVATPAGAKLSMPRWSHDGKSFAFTNTIANGIELWVGDTVSGKVRKITGATINSAFGNPVEWVNNGKLIVQLVVPNRGRPPVEGAAPTGPNVQESAGNAGPVRTYEDMLTSVHDEALFEFYATSQLAFIDVATNKVTPVGKPAIFQSSDVSTDGKYLLVASIHRPFSYLHPASQFPRLVEVWDAANGKPVYKVADLPLAEIPIGGVRSGARNYQWQPSEPSTLVWAEALDDGDPAKKLPHRDRIVALKAPFSGRPSEIFKTEHRLTGFEWLEKDRTILVRENDRERRWNRTFLVSLDQTAAPKVIWDLSAQDRYKDPGATVQQTTADGDRVVMQNGDWILLRGEGASPEGDLPFLDRFNLKTLASERIYRARPNTYESVVAVLSADGSQFLTRYETPTEPPNYFVKTTGGATSQALTKFADPTPLVRKIKKQLVKYNRPDGVPLSFTLYLPPDYKPGTKLPTIMWAYPREFGDADTAGQVSGSSARFTTISGASQLFFALQGFAVLDDASLPVIGSLKEMNDTYIEQIVAGAKAAIDKAAEMGVTDPARVGIAGHSYGGFMTANLLAHSDLFRAGIARSAAYNRTLTPFGFQNEQRTLWEAPDTYLKMSPFMSANKLKEPILFIHGEADDNTGTFPIQSERMYQAVRGHGGTARLVMLPHEAHGYAARESIQHVLYEMLSWFERYVKDVPPAIGRRE